MSVEQTLSIIKPDGVQKNLIGEIYGRFEKAGLRIVAAKMIHLSRELAEGFYAVHKERPFFDDLVNYMTSGPVMVQALEGENAIAKNREVMGATIRRMPIPERLELTLRRASKRTSYTVPTGLIRPARKLLFSSQLTRSVHGLADRRRR